MRARSPLPLITALLAATLLTAASATAQSQATQPQPAASETVQVTATRVPEDVESVPASVTIEAADTLSARGATDLAGALALAAGVAVAPGGDTGPVGAVAELWGLRDIDAFLIVVDGVPWGGAFNPALASLDLSDVERIETLRGSAPVMFGATSFEGVIHVIHRQAGAPGGLAQVSIGSFGSGSASVAMPLPHEGNYQQSLSVSGEEQGFRDDRTGFSRGLLLYRGAAEVGPGTFHFDLSSALVRQTPSSPTPRTGTILTPLVPLDSNQNPLGSRIDEDRIALGAGYEVPVRLGTWSSTLSFAHSHDVTGRGFLVAVSNADPNATGYRQRLGVTDIYFDTHLALRLAPSLELATGFDHLYGSADEHSADFDYFASLDGRDVPRLSTIPAASDHLVGDTRNFSSLYAQATWAPAPRWEAQLGARLNHTSETLSVSAVDLASATRESGRSNKTMTRGNGSLGVSWLAWPLAHGAVWAFADARTTFKPAELDFGPDAVAQILNPETSDSVEVGLKGRHRDGALTWGLSAFRMNFENLVVPTVNAAGQPRLINAGRERFDGMEVEAGMRLTGDALWRVSYSFHDPRYVHFVQSFDGVPVKLDGNHIEVAAQNMAATGLVYAPVSGIIGDATVSWTGARFLDMRNTARAPAYAAWSAGLGYRWRSWEVRLDASNLTDTRPPVAESDLGDAQYYRLPARSFRLGAVARF